MEKSKTLKQKFNCGVKVSMDGIDVSYYDRDTIIIYDKRADKYHEFIEVKL